ncbi:alpha/beta fold hydrolase [Sphingomonas sp. AP4-R1]|uniref:alpha/beta hydrolase family protein n=1 Tax=Sphingomonas sp. AP4-R1 TaxID=2735134 RepID=UPI001493709F|nr:alpha/beta fold hydrolase [Sphingomonas sp. AP4-R1]QJU58922.1 alpha/beta fold hydrolase [Sphingomonas sp. AP4-R1]
MPRFARTMFVIASLSPGIPAVAQDVAERTPWGVESRFPIEQRAFAFRNDGAELRGTLFLPRGGRNLPVVIAFHGAAAPSADHPLYGHLKAMLPPLGVAVLVFDRRGTGRSTGDDARKSDFDLLASDGVAAFRALAADPRFDPRRIGFWGLSQGGWLTLLAAAKEPRAAFAVAVSAPMAGADVQMNYAVGNVMRIKGYPQAEIDRALAARRGVDRYVRGQADRASAERLYRDAEKQPWWRDSYLAGNLDDPTWKGQMAADPLRALDGSRMPTLMVFGQADPWVPVAPALAALDATAAKHPNVTLRVIDGADHSMMLGVSPQGQIDPANFGKLAPDAPAYFGLLASWLTERGIVAAKR